MIARQSDTFRSLLRVVSGPGHGDLPDAELLRRFVSEDDRAAFAALVRRYSPLVHGLCARVLNHRQDAEDAAQATFLVLSTKARTLAPGTALAGWLYGVAHRTARKLRVGNARRRVRERVAAVRVTPDPPAELSVREAQAIIDEELAGLPDRLRAPLVLCALDGLTRDEAARRLGWTLAAVKNRLEQARARLRTRLTRRGLALPAGGLVLLVLGNAATAAVPADFIDSTVRAAERLAIGPPTPDPLSPSVRFLLDGGFRSMTLVKLQAALVGLVLVFGLAGAFCAPGAAIGSAGAPPPVEPKPGAGPADAPKANAAELQGTWTLAETHTRGKKVIRANVWLEPPTLVIIGNRVTLLTHPGSEEGAVEADPRANPKEYTFKWKKPEVGIYAVDGDTLKMCFNPANGIRPTDFATPPDSDRVMAVYQREPARKDDGPPAAPKTDLQKLQGTWVLEETRHDGKVVTDVLSGLIAHSKITIDGHSFTMNLLDRGSGHLHSKLQINEAADPKRITFDWYGGQAHGLYTIEGDTFLFCYTPGAKEPPTKIGAPAGSKAVLLVYKREQVGKKEVGATGQPPVAPKSDLQKLQGTWVLDVNAVLPGPNFIDPPHDKLEIKGRTFTLHHVSGGTQRSSGSSFEMDEAAPGGRIIFNWPNGKAHGIYDLDGDTFRFCYTPGAKEPPAKLEAGPGSKNVLLVYKRESRPEDRGKPGAGASQQPVLFKGHDAPVTAAVFSADGKTLVTADADGMVKVWDVRTGKERASIKRFSVQVTKRPAVPVTLALSPDGATLATSLDDDVPRLWNTATGRERTVLRREPEAGVVMAFSPDGKLLAFRGASGTIDFWNVDTEVDGRRVRAPYEAGRIEVKEPAPREMSCGPFVTFSPDGKTLATVAPDRTVVLRDATTGKELARITDLILKVEPKARNETRIHPLTEEQLRALGLLRPFTFDDVGLAFSPDGRTLALSGAEITLWDVRTGKKTGTLRGRTGNFARLAFSADGKTLTSVGPASAPVNLLTVREMWTGEREKGDYFIGVEVRRWDVDTGRETAAAVIRAYDGDQLKRVRQPNERPRVNFVALSPDLTTMAAAGPDKSVRVWDVAAELRSAPAKKEREPRR